MKKVLPFFFLLLSAAAYGQFDRGAFFEVGGSGGLGSVNYEKRFRGNDELFFTWRAGLSFSPIDRNNGTAIVFPLLVNGITGKSNHKIEAGIGFGVTVTTKGSFFVRSPLTLCYRYQPAGKHFYLRAGYMPLVSYIVDLQWQHWGGVSFGYSFSSEKS